MNTNKAAALATPQTQTDLNLALSRHLASVPAGTKVTADRSCRGLVLLLGTVWREVELPP